MLTEGGFLYYNPCPGSRSDFIEGAHYKVLVYEQKTGCKVLRYFDPEQPAADGRYQIGEVSNVIR